MVITAPLAVAWKSVGISIARFSFFLSLFLSLERAHDGDGSRYGVCCWLARMPCDEVGESCYLLSVDDCDESRLLELVVTA